MKRRRVIIAAKYDRETGLDDSFQCMAEEGVREHEGAGIEPIEPEELTQKRRQEIRHRKPEPHTGTGTTRTSY